jgi:hypothetical protein
VVRDQLFVGFTHGEKLAVRPRSVLVLCPICVFVSASVTCLSHGVRTFLGGRCSLQPPPFIGQHVCTNPRWSESPLSLSIPRQAFRYRSLTRPPSSASSSAHGHAPPATPARRPRAPRAAPSPAAQASVTVCNRLMRTAMGHWFGVTAPTRWGCPAAGGQTHLTGYG